MLVGGRGNEGGEGRGEQWNEVGIHAPYSLNVAPEHFDCLFGMSVPRIDTPQRVAEFGSQTVIPSPSFVYLCSLESRSMKGETFHRMSFHNTDYNTVVVGCRFEEVVLVTGSGGFLFLQVETGTSKLRYKKLRYKKLFVVRN